MDIDLVIVGAGAAGLMTAIQAGRSFPGRRIVLIDGARRPGAKILVAGGGRCNVTHYQVRPEDYCGSTRPAIGKVLRSFGVPDTVRFFDELGVSLHQEATGKLFPVTNQAVTVLDALIGAVRDANVRFNYPERVTSVTFTDGAYHLTTDRGTHVAPRLVLATGGRSLPRSGSDGSGYALARSLGHSLTEPVLPALVPLVLREDYPLRSLAGVTTDVRVTVASGTGKHIADATGSLLCTHFGLSGPVVLDISRHYLFARHHDASARLIVDWLPGIVPESIEAQLFTSSGGTVFGRFRHLLPERLAYTLMDLAGIGRDARAATLRREQRRALMNTVKHLELPLTGSRGFTYAEVTAGGIPLSEVKSTMESRISPGLFLCGEILDVDGRIGGFNFQWAWATGFLAGTSIFR